MDNQVMIEGEFWDVLAEGRYDEETGKVFCHIASTVRGRQQRNGWVPRQRNVWIEKDQIIREVTDEQPKLSSLAFAL